MKNLRSQIVTGTALALLMASPAAAAPSTTLAQAVDPVITGPVPTHATLLAQAEQPATDNADEEEEEPGQRRRPRDRQAGEAPEGGAEAPAERRARPDGPAEGERQAQPEAPAQGEGEPRQRQAQPEQHTIPEAEQPAPRQAQPEEPPAQDQTEPQRPRQRQAQPEQPTAPEAEQPTPRQAQPEEPPAQDQTEPQRPRQRQAQPEQPTAPEAEQPTPRQAQPEEPPAQDQTEPQRPRQRQAQPEQPAIPEAEQPAPRQAQPEEPPAQDQTEPQQPRQQQAEPAQPEGAAPILDSAKERRRGDGPRQPGGQEAGQQPPPRADAPPPPQSDEAAQSDEIRRERVEPVTAEEGRRIEFGNTREERRQARRERHQRRENAQVVREFDDNRAIIEIGNRVFIESPDNDRIILDRDEVYYEELPRGRTREVITRPDGTKVVTIRNRYGDVVRRSRVLPDNREVVLVYVEDRYYDDVRDFRDPGDDLPPLVLNIPRRDYILEAEMADGPDVYYEFFEQPPVEQIQRTYSIGEVKRSARLRDTVRRIDLDTINFEFGSAAIAQSEVDELQGVAEAMQRILEQNPGETFLIEGHTDAVGSDLANLALSDRRAEAVAEALTSVFDIPPENLATQGYGEQYLKVDTEEPERENRRVAMRRITPLVAPVAQAR